MGDKRVRGRIGGERRAGVYLGLCRGIVGWAAHGYTKAPSTAAGRLYLTRQSARHGTRTLCLDVESCSTAVCSGLCFRCRPAPAIFFLVASPPRWRLPTMNTRPVSPPASRPKNSSASIPSSAAASPQPSAAMASSSSKPRGLTPTTSRSSVKAADQDKPARPASRDSRDSLKQKLAKKADDTPRPSRSDEVTRPTRAAAQSDKDTAADNAQQLKALRSDFDGLRSLLTCKICTRLYQQPFFLSCGHTYCYTVRDRYCCLWTLLILRSASAHGGTTTGLVKHVPTVDL